MIKTLMAGTALSMVFAAAPALAQSKQDLQAQINALQQQLNKLEAEVEEDSSKKNAGEESDFDIKWEPAPSIKSKDGRFEMNLRGRIFVDAGWISDDYSSVDTKATEFRTARLGIEGKAWNNVKYKFEIDFADNEVDVKDAYIQPKFGSVKVTLGQHKTSNSLEEQTSSRYITFMERAAFTDAFGLSRNIGISVGTGGDNWTLTAGAFRGSNGVDNLDEGSVFAFRGTFGPKIGEKTQAHIGASFRYRMIGDDQSELRYRQRPFSHLAPMRFVNTGSRFDEDTLLGVEAAVVHGPFSLQGEYAFVSAQDPDVGASEKYKFTGGYISATFYLTGESRKYDPKKGSFGRPKVNNPVLKGGMGAWQVAYRYDMVDLSDTVNLTGGGTDILAGGEQTSHIIGINWWWNRYMRMMFNYSHSKITDAFDVFDDGVNEVDTFSIRAQVDW